jgi:hypothetical protein
LAPHEPCIFRTCVCARDTIGKLTVAAPAAPAAMAAFLRKLRRDPAGVVLSSTCLMVSLMFSLLYVVVGDEDHEASGRNDSGPTIAP